MLVAQIPLRRWLIAMAAVAPGCGEKNVFQPPPPPTVTVERPVQRSVTISQDFVGRTEASETVEIRARVKGFLESIDFVPSQLVSQGDLLFTIERDKFEAEAAGAEAALAQAVAARDLADATLKRAQSAYAQQAVSELELLERTAQLDAAQAEVQAREARLADAQLELSYTRIYAPIDGRVSRDLVTLGNLVGSDGATLLTTIVKDDPIFAYFNVNERELLPYLEDRSDVDAPQQPKVRSARLQLSDGTEFEGEGQIDFADNRVDNVTGTIELRARFPNPGARLIPGLFVRVLIPEDEREVLLVPEFALQRDLAGPYLLVVNGDSMVERRDVGLGERLDDMRIIESGLDGSERVIVSGLQRARDGIEVKVDQAAVNAGRPAAEAG